MLRGRALVGGLMEGCLEHGVEFVSDTRGRSLIVEDGRVVGVRAEQEGQELEYRASYGVVLARAASSGTASSGTRSWPSRTTARRRPPYNRGDGLVMAAEVGAKLANLDKATWIPARYFGEEYDGHPSCGGPWLRPASGRDHRQPQGPPVRQRDPALQRHRPRRITHFDPHTYEWENHPAS